AELDARSLRERLSGRRYDLRHGVAGDRVGRESIVRSLHGAVDRNRNVARGAVLGQEPQGCTAAVAREQHVIAAEHQDADLIFLAYGLHGRRLLGIAIAREVERALDAGVEVDGRERLRLRVDDGVAPGRRKMNAASHAGGRIGAAFGPGLRTFGRDNHLGGVVGIHEPDRAVVKRKQQALALIVGVDLAHDALLAARARLYAGADRRDAALTVLPGGDVGENDLAAFGH